MWGQSGWCRIRDEGGIVSKFAGFLSKLCEDYDEVPLFAHRVILSFLGSLKRKFYRPIFRIQTAAKLNANGCLEAPFDTLQLAL